MNLIQLMPDASEIIQYDEVGIPLYIRQGILSKYPGMQATCHWHEDLEFIHILSGEMGYFINGERILLHAGDSLFVNARQMHYGYAREQKDCHFLCMLIHPSLLTGNQQLAEKTVQKLISDHSFLYYAFCEESPEREKAGRLLHQIWLVKQEQRFAYQMDAVGMLLSMIAMILRKYDLGLFGHHPAEGHTLMLQRQMVAYIAAHYTEQISLEELSASAAISKSTCERLFKTYIGLTPLQYLTNYRLEASRHLLESTDRSITEIAFLCGFNHTSYYGRLFLQTYGTTPSSYRKNIVSSSKDN